MSRRRSSDYGYLIPLIIGGGLVAVLQVVAGVLTIVQNSEEKKAFDAYTEEIEAVVATEQNLKDFTLGYFELVKDNNECFLTLSGSATRNDDSTIDLVMSKYEVDEEMYNDVINYMNENELSTEKPNSVILEKVLNILKTSNLVEFNQIEETNEVYNSENMIISKISKPVVGEDFVYYDVSVVKTDKNSPNIDIITARVYYERTKELEANPTKVYAMSNKEAYVQKMDAQTYTIMQDELFVLNNKTMKI